MTTEQPVTWKKDLLDPEFIKKDHVAIAILVMWAIWSNRSKYAHGEVKFQPHKSMEIIYELIRALDIPSSVEVTNVGSKALYNARHLGVVFREVNWYFFKHRCLIVKGRRLIRCFSCTNRH